MEIKEMNNTSRKGLYIFLGNSDYRKLTEKDLNIIKKHLKDDRDELYNDNCELRDENIDLKRLLENKADIDVKSLRDKINTLNKHYVAKPTLFQAQSWEKGNYLLATDVYDILTKEIEK